MSLDSKANNKYPQNSTKDCIDIAVIRLPRISNFTDFLALETMPNISLRYVTNPKELGTPDLLIIPGSKNTIADMKFLRETGFEREINNLRNSQTTIIGICGGLQMLGKKISDPNGIEGELSEINGLGLLPINTILTEEKKLIQTQGTISNLPFADKGIPFQGYEIHAGESEICGNKNKTKTLTDCEDSKNYGYFTEDGTVLGTYIHGFFDSAELRTALLKKLANNNPAVAMFATENIQNLDKEQTYNHLADMLEKYIDLERF